MATPTKSHSRRFGWRLFAASTAVLAVTGLVAGGVNAGNAHNSHPVSSKQIPNLTLVIDQIESYYGDYVDSTGAHQASATSAYAKEVGNDEKKALRTLLDQRRVHGKKAVVFDVDDTTLLTYNYEAANQFGYIPAVNAQYVLGEKFPAVFGMNTLETTLKNKGYAVFFITGRPEPQRAATLGNLNIQGYTAPTSPAPGLDGLFLKPASGGAFPSYINCNSDGIAACSTTEYKSQTRKYIESLGYDIVGNFGDQYSDLNGGYSDHSFKLPNPMYYLP